MKKWMNLILLSCKRATELVEKKHVDSLTAKESVQLQIHTAICLTCRSYSKQSDVINDAMSNIAKRKSLDNQVLSDKSKKEILKKINHS